MPAVAKLIQCLRGEVVDDRFMSEGPLAIRDAWAALRVSVRDLLMRFESEMSPKVLIDEPPLSGLGEESRAFLRELMHDLWLRRHSVDRLLANARQALDDAEIAGATMMTALEKKPANRAGSHDDSTALSATAFHESLSNLTAAMSALPPSILVI